MAADELGEEDDAADDDEIEEDDEAGLDADEAVADEDDVVADDAAAAAAAGALAGAGPPRRPRQPPVATARPKRQAGDDRHPGRPVDPGPRPGVEDLRASGRSLVFVLIFLYAALLLRRRHVQPVRRADPGARLRSRPPTPSVAPSASVAPSGSPAASGSVVPSGHSAASVPRSRRRLGIARPVLTGRGRADARSAAATRPVDERPDARSRR